MKNKELLEETYNPSGYADYLANKHYHHSDKGCQIEMGTELGTRKGEVSLLGVVKRCLTHNCVCSKTGWEHGWYGGTNSRVASCECGKELEGKNHLCYDCRESHKQDSRLKEIKKRNLMSEFVKRMRLEKIAKNTKIN